MLSYLLAGGERVLSLTEPYLAATALQHWRLRRRFYRLQKRAGFRSRMAPHQGGVERFSRFLWDMALENGCRHLVVKETYRSRVRNPHWRNETTMNRLVASAADRVALIRHPYDVVASTVKLCHWITGPRVWVVRVRWPSVPRFHSPDHVARWAAENWASYVAWLGELGMTPIRYEDFVGDPRRELPGICRQLNVPYEDAMLDDTGPRRRFGGLGDPGTMRAPRPVDNCSVGRGGKLMRDQQRIVRQTCGHLVGEFDYVL